MRPQALESGDDFGCFISTARSGEREPRNTAGAWIVWRKSQGLGCGQAMCADGANIVVCNYEPAGNIDGEPAY